MKTNTTRHTSHQVKVVDTLSGRTVYEFGFQDACRRGRTVIAAAWDIAGSLCRLDQHCLVKIVR